MNKNEKKTKNVDNNNNNSSQQNKKSSNQEKTAYFYEILRNVEWFGFMNGRDHGRIFNRISVINEKDFTHNKITRERDFTTHW
jgi:ribosomal protein S4